MLIFKNNKMATARKVEVLMNKTLKDALDFIKYVFGVDQLYDDQMSLIEAFINGSNIYFNAPTGYGKSIVYQCLPWVCDVLNEQTIGFSTLLVISPLQSLTEDQCVRMKNIGISSIALYSENASDESILQEVREGVYSLVYASPECLLGKQIWRSILCSDEFRDHCIGVAYDEAHIIAQWGCDEEGKFPFRKWYGELQEFRCPLQPGITFALFTATATKQTKQKILSILGIESSETFFIEKNPERENIKYCVEYIDNSLEIASIFSSVIEELKEKKEKCSRKLIYTQTRVQCATIFNAFSSQLEDNIFINGEPNPKLRLVDMFHGGSPEAVKKHIVKQLALSDSCLRIVICTVAFGMGVNCSGVIECIHFGPPKSIEAYVQESGRIGRDGSSSISRILYNAMLLKGANQQMRNYLKETQCRRNTLMKHFEKYIPRKPNGCHCCDNCMKDCNCSSSCNHEWVLMTNYLPEESSISCVNKRNVSPEQKKQLHALLVEYCDKLRQERTKYLPSVHAEFYSFHINQIVTKCQYLFTLNDVYHNIEIWRKVYAYNVLSILKKVFGDITENISHLDTYMLDCDESLDSLPDEWLSMRDDSAIEEFGFCDSYMFQSFDDCSLVTNDDEKIIEQSLDEPSLNDLLLDKN